MVSTSRNGLRRLRIFWTAMSANHPLATAFLTTYTGIADDRDVLESMLVGILREARTTYPRVALEDAVYASHLGQRLEAGKPVFDALAEVHTSDLFLARACAAGNAQALSIFEQQCMRGSEGSVRRRGVSDEAIEEAKQNVRERMLAGDGAPRILDYNGRGDLRRWLRVAVVREAIYLAKRAEKHAPLAYDLLSIPASSDDPEVGYFKAHYRAEYKAAFGEAIALLTARERSLLRQQYVLGMTVDEIGTVYQVHRATAARWVQSAREELLSKARLELAKRVGLSRAELENIIRMIESQLHVSLSRLLAARSRAPS